MARSVMAACLLAVILLPGLTVEVRAQSFGCLIGFRQQPRIWIYTDPEGAGRRLRPVRISETVGEVLEELAPEDGRRPYSFEVVRNNEAHNLIDDLDLLSCTSGKRLDVAVRSRKILKYPEDPKSFTLMSFTFTLRDPRKLKTTREVELGPFRLLLADPGDPGSLKAALAPIIAERLADCLFDADPGACKGGA
ncbi:MAG: hypothetical protein QNJ30_09000 [Kiloniellales bacterium]|nr:hypothetical protein [Kiloniellales bacterium]